MHNLLVILYKLLTTAFSISFLLIHAIVFIREYLMHHANEIHKTPQIHIIPIAISYSLPFYKNTLYETKNSGQLWSLFFVFPYFIINTLKIIFFIRNLLLYHSSSALPHRLSNDICIFPIFFCLINQFVRL